MCIQLQTSKATSSFGWDIIMSNIRVGSRTSIIFGIIVSLSLNYTFIWYCGWNFGTYASAYVSCTSIDYALAFVPQFQPQDQMCVWLRLKLTVVHYQCKSEIFQCNSEASQCNPEIYRCNSTLLLQLTSCSVQLNHSQLQLNSST